MDRVYHTLAPAEMDMVPHTLALVEIYILVPAENVRNPYSQTSPAALTQGDGPNP